MKVLVAMAPFKGTLTNFQASRAVAEVLMENGMHPTVLPIGDGGSGTFSGLDAIYKGKWSKFSSENPLGKPVEATVFCAAETHTVYLETSQVCGYTLITPNERNALLASSRGLGLLINQIVETLKPKKIVFGLGDSAISDCGRGMLEALKANLSSISLEALCDVINPLCGPEGSARVFAPQKGATPEQVIQIERRMEDFAQLVQKNHGHDVRNLPFAGSAGGLAAALYGVLGSQLKPGAETLLDILGFNEIAQKHALVITGEGKTDRQTLKGKAPFSCIARCTNLGVPVALISGVLGEGSENLSTFTHLKSMQACGSSPSATDALKKSTRELIEKLS